MDQQDTPSEVDTSAPVAPSAPAKRTLLGSVAHWARDLMISVVLAVFVILFIYQPVKVEGTSMMPTLDDQERIFINKFVYRFHFGNIDRGDTVVFWFPGDPTKSYIKRVIGMPGDRVEVNDGKVIVNGQALVESYVPPEFRDQSSMSARPDSRRTSISCSAITAVRPTTAGLGAWSRAGTSTAKPFSFIGRWTKWACCASAVM